MEPWKLLVFKQMGMVGTSVSLRLNKFNSNFRHFFKSVLGTVIKENVFLVYLIMFKSYTLSLQFEKYLVLDYGTLSFHN